MRGRKPTPTKILETRGSRRAKGRKAEPKPLPVAPECPDWLDAEARAEWSRIVPELLAIRVLARIDRAALANYCVAWSRLRAAQAIIDKEGLTIESEFGPKKRPEVSIAERAAKLVLDFLREFGLSPASRPRLHVPDKPAETSKARFFKK